MNDKQNGALSVRDQVSEPVVACYVTQETNLPAKFQGEFQIVTVKVLNSSGRAVEKPALRVTFSHDQSIEEPVGLLGFGSDLRCHVLLPAGVVSPVHCKVYAQLNSGPQFWLVDDTSEQGTGVEDDDSSSGSLNKIVQGRRQAAPGLRALTLGPYKFQIWQPTSNNEIQRRDDWYKIHKPIPVTLPMLARQLGSVQWNWLQREKVGEGGNAAVYKYMETNTALLIAIKEEEITNDRRKAQIAREVKLMKTLRHPNLVDFIFDDAVNKPMPTNLTAMPLYLGHLGSILPLPGMRLMERIMLQIADGLHFMHSNLILHRDLKPENILVASPEDIKIADYRWAASLNDHHRLQDLCGTVSYCAPEALRTNAIHTPAIDVYSLGAVFYSILDLDKVESGWVRRKFRGKYELFNTTFENASGNPPHHFPGLVQSMLDPDPKGRCSLVECMNVVKGKNHDWTYKTPLMPVATGMQLFSRNANKAQIPRPIPLTKGKCAERRPCPQKPPGLPDYKNWRPACERLLPMAPALHPLPVQKPFNKPAQVRKVDFTAGLPSYEEATNLNPFAPLALGGAKKNKPSHRELNPSDIHPAFRTKAPSVQRAPAPAAHNKPKEKSVRVEASSVARAALLTSAHRRQQPVLRSHNRALNLHRARDARIQRQADRQEARDRRKAKLREGLCEATRGTWKIVTALLGFACDGLVVGGERVYDRFRNNRAARDALEHVVANVNVNVNADRKLVVSVQRQAKGHKKVQTASRTRTDAELLDRQLRLSRRR